MSNNLSATWLAVNIGNDRYSINSSFVKGITELTVAMYKEPKEYSSFIKGVYSVYGSPLTIIDMRRVLGKDSMDNEKMKKIGEIYSILNKHEVFMDQLEWAIIMNEELSIDKDYTSDILKSIMNIDKKNSRLKHIKRSIVDCMELIYKSSETLIKDRDNGVIREYCMEVTELKRQSDKYIVDKIDKIIDIESENYTEVCIVIQSKEDTFGIAIDRIDSITDNCGEINKNTVGKVSAGTINIKGNTYEILNITKLRKLVK